VVFTGKEKDKQPRTYVQDISGGPPRAITAPGITGFLISPDGSLLFGNNAGGKSVLVSLKSGDLHPVTGLEANEHVIRWSADGRWLYIYQGRNLPITIHRLDPRDGRRELIREIVPPDPAGLVGSPRVFVSAAGDSYVYQSERHLSDLYLARGLMP